MKAVEPYRVDNVRMRVLSPDEIQRVLESCRPALQLNARTTLESLPRLSEVLNHRVEDLGPDYARRSRRRSAWRSGFEPGFWPWPGHRGLAGVAGG
jgi:integrase